MTKYSLKKLFKNTFEGHKGRPGKRGGSLPRSAGGGPKRYGQHKGEGGITSEDREAEVIYKGLKFMLPGMTTKQHEALFEATFHPGEDPDETLSRIEKLYNANSKIVFVGDTPTNLFDRMMKDIKG
jgi:hypothetical protein